MEREISGIQKNKAEIFAATDAFNWSEYESFLGTVESIFDIHEPAAREDKFIQIWDQVLKNLIDPSREAEPEKERTSAMKMANLFESSFKFFSADVPDDIQKRIANAQLEFILNPQIKNEELQNVCKGMWGYYVSPEKFYARKDIMAPRSGREDAEYINRRQELRRALDSLRKNEMEALASDEGTVRLPQQTEVVDRNVSPSAMKRMFYLTLAESGSLRFEGFQDEAETIRYFADLYSNDNKPLTPVAEDAVDREESSPAGAGPDAAAGGREQSGSHFEIGVKMPPHTRFFNFRSSLLPTDDTIGAGRVRLFMSKDQRISPNPEEGKKVIRGSEKTDILIDILPIQFLVHYLQRLRPVRLTDAYREADENEQKEMRLKAVRSFTNDLFDFNSSLWQQLNTNFTDQPELLERIKDQIKTYDSSSCYLAFSIAVNSKDTETRITG